MTQIILDAALRSKLNNLTQPLELCDDSGRVVAVVTPMPNPADYEPVEPPPLSEKELQRRRAEPEYSTQEVLDYLVNL
jgi:hypothetical protein